KDQVLRAGKHGGSEGAREWLLLGDYEMAAFAVIRAGCCAEPPPLDLPASGGTCARVDKALNKLAVAATSGKGSETAIAGYVTSVQCAIKIGAGGGIGLGKPLQGGEEAEFRKTLQRVVASKPRPQTPSSATAPPQSPLPKRIK